MLRFLLLTGLLCGLFSTPADARTIRYEFDVVGSAINYKSLSKLSADPNANPTISAAEYDAFVAAFHPLGNLLGQIGSVAFEIQESVTGHPFSDNLTCFSGFLCSDFRLNGYVNFHPTGFLTAASGGGGREWSLTAGIAGSGTFRFLEDGAISGSGTMGADSYFWWIPQARFDLANLTITDVTSVPLPAGAPLLAGALLTFAAGARRRARKDCDKGRNTG